MSQTVRALAVAGILPGLAGGPAQAAGSATRTRALQAARTPDEALRLPREGNARFVAGTTVCVRLGAQALLARTPILVPAIDDAATGKVQFLAEARP